MLAVLSTMHGRWRCGKRSAPVANSSSRKLRENSAAGEKRAQHRAALAAEPVSRSANGLPRHYADPKG